jgi:hypothetical protein
MTLNPGSWHASNYTLERLFHESVCFVFGLMKPIELSLYNSQPKDSSVPTTQQESQPLP